MKQLYEKVEIHSESDLPKTEMGVKHWGHTRSGRMIETDITWTWRVNDIDWYLRPYQMPEVTDEDIKHASMDYSDEHLFEDFPNWEQIQMAYQMGARDMRSNNIYISTDKSRTSNKEI
jgi:hypothetical protein